MTAIATTPAVRNWVVALLRGETLPPPSELAGILALCEAEDITPLIAAAGRSSPDYHTWPHDLREAIESAERAAAARELAVRAQLERALNALADAGVAPLLLKGTPLAYTIYDAPSHRGRDDTDILVSAGDVDRACAALRAIGYADQPYSAGAELFGQVPVVYRDELGLKHWLDIHWALSTARVFAEALSYDELFRAAIPVPALGPSARTVSLPHALLLACMHPVMHHRNAERLAWTYDVHLLAERLDPAGWSSFVELVRTKRVRQVACHGLDQAVALFATRVPTATRQAIAPDATSEPTAAYLAEGRGWLQELGSNLSARTSWRSRLGLLREIALPSASYLFASYRVASLSSRWLLLPLLYAHRGARGAWRLARGRK